MLHRPWPARRIRPDWSRSLRTAFAEIPRLIAFSSVRVEVHVETGGGQGTGSRCAQRRVTTALSDYVGCTRGDWLLSAHHHRDDQAETLLLNLLRGSRAGWTWPVSAEVQPPRFEGWLVRPLLIVHRDAKHCEDYAARQGAWPGIDDTFQRGPAASTVIYLRHEIMPVPRTPLAGSHLSRLARRAHCWQARRLTMLDQLADKDLQVESADRRRERIDPWHRAGRSLSVGAATEPVALRRARNLGCRHRHRRPSCGAIVEQPRRRHVSDAQPLRRVAWCRGTALPGLRCTSWQRYPRGHRCSCLSTWLRLGSSPVVLPQGMGSLSLSPGLRSVCRMR